MDKIIDKDEDVAKDIPDGAGTSDFDYDFIEVTNPGAIAVTVNLDENDNLQTKIEKLFPSYNELNAAIAYITASPDSRETIRENQKYLVDYQFEFLNGIVLSPVISGSKKEIDETLTALKEAVLKALEEMEQEEEDQSD